MRRKRLGDLLRERGRISHKDLTNAVQEQQAKAVLLGELLLKRGLVGKEDLASALEEITRIKYVDCQAVTVDPEILSLIPRSVAVRYSALPLHREGKKLVTVMAEPQNLTALDELRFISGMEISPRLGFGDDIRAAIDRCYGQGSAATQQAEEEELLHIDEDLASEIEFFTHNTRQSSQEAAREFQAALVKQRTPAVRLVSAMIAAAASKKASDIHVDPPASAAAVRIRVDGMLRDLMEIPTQFQESLVSRIKILANMDIAERRAPQDGRFLVRLGSAKLDLRVATLPTHYGEKVVIRLLDPTTAQVKLQDLGLSEKHAATITNLLARPQGMLLVTGPTGSGKTTTLYAALNVLRSRTVDIITVEDPVEYMLDGINQVQVNAKAGRTFASCLRSILRQDPNVIMVGEVRDAETAEIALTASQTGHFVLSTLHTNDSIAAITRLADLNIPPFLIASSVTAIIAQRLVRRLCSCRKDVEVTPEYGARLLAAGLVAFKSKMLAPAGCPACDNTGYKGRVGIFEIFVLDDPIRAAIRSGAPPNELRNLARNAGMRLLQEEALDKVQSGLTSFEEVLRVVPFDSIPPVRCRSCNRHLAPEFLLCPYCGADRREARAEGPAVSVLKSVAEGEREE